MVEAQFHKCECSLLTRRGLGWVGCGKQCRGYTAAGEMCSARCEQVDRKTSVTVVEAGTASRAEFRAETDVWQLKVSIGLSETCGAMRVMRARMQDAARRQSGRANQRTKESLERRWEGYWHSWWWGGKRDMTQHCAPGPSAAVQLARLTRSANAHSPAMICAC